MVKKQAVILNLTGLHARPASDFVVLAKHFISDITIRNLETKNPPVNAKSVLMLLGEGLVQGTHIEISAKGHDEVIAVETLVKFIESGLDQEG